MCKFFEIVLNIYIDNNQEIMYNEIIKENFMDISTEKGTYTWGQGNLLTPRCQTRAYRV